MNAETTKKRFTTKEYTQMIETGILSEDDQVELIEGEIIEMTPIGSKHAACVDRLNGLLNQRLTEGEIVRVQSPINLGQDSQPQPDVAILKSRDDFYAEDHPGPEDTDLVVEVSETSRSFDRRVKVPLYGRNGIPEVWLIDLEEDLLEVHYLPSNKGYKEVHKYDRGESVGSTVISGLEIAVDEVLG